MTTMSDLKKAIEDVIQDSVILDGTSNGCTHIEGVLVDKEAFNILIAEYNIHFIEPEDKQEEYELS